MEENIITIDYDENNSSSRKRKQRKKKKRKQKTKKSNKNNTKIKTKNKNINKSQVLHRQRNKNKNEKTKDKEKIKEDEFEELENVSNNGKNYSVFDNVKINGQYCTITKIKKYFNNDQILIEIKEYQESKSFPNCLYLKWIEKKDDVKLNLLGEKIKVFSCSTFNKLYANKNHIPNNVWFCQFIIDPNLPTRLVLLNSIDGCEKIYDSINDNDSSINTNDNINIIDVESHSSLNKFQSDSSNGNSHKIEFGYNKNRVGETVYLCVGFPICIYTMRAVTKKKKYKNITKLQYIFDRLRQGMKIKLKQNSHQKKYVYKQMNKLMILVTIAIATQMLILLNLVVLVVVI